MKQHNWELGALSAPTNVSGPVIITFLAKRFPPRVFYCPPAPRAPVHKLRSWMSVAYHNRIQKKWNKRFGTKVVFTERPRDPKIIYPELVGSGRIHGVTHR